MPSCLKCTSAEGIHACSRCIVARYCSAECQRAHFPAHKAECKRAQSMAQMKLAFLKVTSFQDLLDRNLAYLSGELDFNPYTHSKISEDADLTPIIPKLKAVTQRGYYTITGQPSKAAYNVLDSKKSLYVSVEQRNYTSGWLQEKVAEHLEAWLKSSRHKHDVYYRLDFDSKEKGYFVQQNMPFSAKNNGFNLSRYYETPTSHEAALPTLSKDSHAWNERVNVFDDVVHRRNVFFQYKDFPKIMDLFLGCAGVYLATREYNSDVSVEDIMAEFLEHYHAGTGEVTTAVDAEGARSAAVDA